MIVLLVAGETPLRHKSVTCCVHSRIFLDLAFHSFSFSGLRFPTILFPNEFEVQCYIGENDAPSPSIGLAIDALKDCGA